MASPHKVPAEQVRAMLSEVLQRLESPEYAGRLDEAKEAAGNEMLKMMQIVFPMVVQIEMEVIKHYGFSATREGTVQFVQLVRETELVDGEVARLHGRLRAHYLPPVSVSSAADNSL